MPPAPRQPWTADRVCRTAAEAVVLALVVFAPWAFGAVEPVFGWVVLAGIAVLLLLWAAALVIRREAGWHQCPVLIGLAALTLFTGLQLLPLPPAVLAVV